MAHPHHVLHVLDDDTLVRKVTCRIAERAGFRAEGFAEPGPFLDATTATPPDLILLDLAIGAADGIAVLEQLARRRCRTPLIVYSGLGDRLLGTAVRIGQKLGLTMLAPLPKPIEPAELAAALRKAALSSLPINAGDLDQALQAGQFVPHYQPKIRLSDRAPIGAEALVRWNHPTRGVLPPASFIALAEDGSVMTPMTFRTIERAVRDCAAWRQLIPDVSVAVNVSARSLGEPDFADRVAEVLLGAGAHPSMLTLEVTETAAMADTAAVAAALARLRIRGISLSMDDFGTGYSSLTELHRMPFSELKIDRSFVSGMLEDREAFVITGAVVALARALGLRSVAEGVEDAPTLDALAGMGCDVAQGFGIGRPMPQDAFLAWLAEAAAAQRVLPAARPPAAPPPGAAVAAA